MQKGRLLYIQYLLVLYLLITDCSVTFINYTDYSVTFIDYANYSEFFYDTNIYWLCYIYIVIFIGDAPDYSDIEYTSDNEICFVCWFIFCLMKS